MNKSFKIKLAAIAKDEGFYLPLWVYHHFYFGFDVIDIRVNNNTDNSIEILEKLKLFYGDRLQYSFADKELAEAKHQDINFQTYIYGKILEETLQEDFTHLMFMDIDEYWCSANFQSTIKDFLSETNNFDVCMFQWLMEVPDPERKIDDFLFDSTLFGHKNVHVKSLANLQIPIRAVRAHNYIVRKGHYILPNTTIVNFSDDDVNRGVVPEELHKATCMSLGDYFVYHKAFRSQDEYIASLLRGNKIDGDDSLLKSNRSGFLPTASIELLLCWALDEAILESYKSQYQQLMDLLKDEMAIARVLILDRRNAVLDYLKDDYFFQQVHANKMAGINTNIYQVKKNNYPIKATVKNILFDEHKLVCSFDCELLSDDDNYELIISHSTNKLALAAIIDLKSSQPISQKSMKIYHCEIPISELSSLVYRRQPPFCLVAKLTTSNEWLLLERVKFRNIAPTLITHARQFREKQRKQQSNMTKNNSVPLKQPSRIGFWRKFFSKLSGIGLAK